jgi:hypothetical protein
MTMSDVAGTAYALCAKFAFGSSGRGPCDDNCAPRHPIPVPLHRSRLWPAKSQLPLEPPEISESEVEIDEKTQDRREKTPNREQSHYMYEVRRNEKQQHQHAKQLHEAVTR